MRKIPIVVGGLILLLFYIQQTTTDITPYCSLNGQGTFWEAIRRDFVHGSAMQLLWVISYLYGYFELERLIGSVRMLLLIIWLIVLSNVIHYYSTDYVNSIVEKNRQQKTLQTINKAINQDLPCDLGFLGVAIALEVVSIYLTSTGQLHSSLHNIQWFGLHILPALLFANVTVHGQISGFTAGILTVLLLGAII